jgi:hypothetical protein
VLTNHQCTSTPAAPAPWLWWRAEQAVLAGWVADPDGADEAVLFDAHVAAEWGITDPAARAALRGVALGAMDANLALQTCTPADSRFPEDDRPTSNWLLWDGIGGLEQLANTSCHAADPAHCDTFGYLYNASLMGAALAEKDGAVAAYEALNATTWASVLPAVPNATFAAVLAASLETGLRVARLIAAGWHVMALGYAGDRGGGVYNVTALRAAIATYDAVRAAYYALPARYPAGLLPANYLMNDTYWEHPSSGQAGMKGSVDRYRGLLLPQVPRQLPEAQPTTRGAQVS